jgi:hypothetical protein
MLMSLVPQFIDHILRLQQKNDPFFPGGLLPAYRTNPILRYSRPDTNVFFSAISAFTLLYTVRPAQSEEIQQKIDHILTKIRETYPEFQNKDGLRTYNFFKTRPSRHFPNGYLLNRLEHFRIPDDIDDTAMIYLTSQPTSEELSWLKDKLTHHANGTKQWIRNTYPEYKNLKAYSTWFGKNMYIEFDCCVLSNMLCCIYHYDLPLNQHDTDSLQYIKSVIETDRYIIEPFRCAHQYPRTYLIAYHVARLIGLFNPESLRSVKDKLIRDCYYLLAKAEHVMERIVLSIALLRMGEQPAKIDTRNISKSDFEGFYFFIAGLLTAYENPILYQIASSKLFHMYWICEAHSWVLLAEYEVLAETASR